MTERTVVPADSPDEADLTTDATATADAEHKAADHGSDADSGSAAGIAVQTTGDSGAARVPIGGRLKVSLARIRAELVGFGLTLVVSLYGRLSATLSFLIFPLDKVELAYLHKNGVDKGDLCRVQKAFLRQNFGAVLGILSFMAGFLRLTQLSVRDPADRLPTSVLMIVAIAAGIVSVMVASASESPRFRLLASAARCARLVLILDPQGEPSLMRRALADYFDNPIYRRRRVAGIAWALTRDTARMTGRPVTAGATIGELLLWFAESPGDRRRRPILSGHLVELVTALAGDLPIPDAQFTPAARFRTRSPRGRVWRQLRALGSGALATGVLLAIVAAILRMWIK